MFSEIFKDLPPGKRFQWGNPSGAYEGRGVPISKLLEPSNHGVRRWHLLRKTTTISNKRSRVKKKQNKNMKKKHYLFTIVFFFCVLLSFFLFVRSLREVSSARMHSGSGAGCDWYAAWPDWILFYFYRFPPPPLFFFCSTPFGEIQTAVENCKR